jgi:hypothetical protein
MDQGSTSTPADRPKPAATTPERAVDFSALLFDLRRGGYGVEAIAMHANLSRSAIRNYCAGNTTPLHPHGERLIAVWCELSGSPRDAVPMARAFPRVLR